MHTTTSNGASNGTSAGETSETDRLVETLLDGLIGAQHDGADATREVIADREAEAAKAAASLASRCRKLARAAAGLDPSSKLTPREAREALDALLRRIVAKRGQ